MSYITDKNPGPAKRFSWLAASRNALAHYCETRPNPNGRGFQARIVCGFVQRSTLSEAGWQKKCPACTKWIQSQIKLVKPPEGKETP